MRCERQRSSLEVERLRETNTELRLARREVEKSRKHKNQVLDEHKDFFLWTARTLESFYQLAGEPKLAAQIRPSGRRPGRRAVEVADDASSDQAPSEASGEQASASVNPASKSSDSDSSSEDSAATTA